MKLPRSLEKKFKAIAGAQNVLTDEEDRLTYSYDAAVLEPVIPALVVRPETTEALGRVVGLCNDNGLKLYVRGAGTNLSGGTIPHTGGVVVLTRGLNNILEVNREDMFAVVQPGVVTADLAANVRRQGLFYPPDPASMAVSTLGGNVAENAGGLLGLKYGVTADYVMGIEFFDARGELVRTGSRTVKCATGYNLAGLMAGSEGTLGVFCEITLRLVPPPAEARAMTAVFGNERGASETVAAVIAAGIVPATMEFMDNFTIRTVEAYSRAGLPTEARALLLLELDGHPAQVEDDSAGVKKICLEHGADSVKTAANSAERDRLWQARRDALPALSRLKPTCVLEDATVPRSKVPEMISAIEEISRKLGITIGTFGHAGDGNLHPTILTDKRDAGEWKRVEKAIDEIFDKALSLGGTLSGEHGIGIAKAKYLELEIGRGAIEYSKKLKSALDPRNILNPGKMVS